MKRDIYDLCRMSLSLPRQCTRTTASESQALYKPNAVNLQEFAACFEATTATLYAQVSNRRNWNCYMMALLFPTCLSVATNAMCRHMRLECIDDLKSKDRKKYLLFLFIVPFIIALFLDLGAKKPKWIQADLLSALIMWCNIIISVFGGQMVRVSCEVPEKKYVALFDRGGLFVLVFSLHSGLIILSSRLLL